jgi:hypothetical protein
LRGKDAVRGQGVRGEGDGEEEGRVQILASPMLWEVLGRPREPESEPSVCSGGGSRVEEVEEGVWLCGAR